MLKLLKWIKSKLPFLWTMIQWFNGLLIKIFFGKRINTAMQRYLPQKDNNCYDYRLVEHTDLPLLVDLMQRQPEGYDNFFKPHKFDLKTFNRIYKNDAFLMMGVFDGPKAIGYFFVRFFSNKKSFRGYMVDAAYQGKGIAKTMGQIITNISTRSQFRMFATISKYNVKSMAASQAVNELKILEKMDNGDYYVEYLPKTK